MHKKTCMNCLIFGKACSPFIVALSDLLADTILKALNLE